MTEQNKNLDLSFQPPDEPIIVVNQPNTSARDREHPNFIRVPITDTKQPASYFLGSFDRYIAPFVRAVERSPTIQVLAAVLVLVGAFQIISDYNARDQERIERAWTRLLRNAPGNTGKGQAFNYLISRGQPLDGLDLSCRAIGSFDLSQSKCIQPAYILNLRLEGSQGRIYRLNLAGAHLGSPVFKNWKLNEINLSDATLLRCVFEDSEVDGNLVNATLEFCSFRKSTVIGTANILASDVSAAVVAESSLEVDPRVRSVAWNSAWADYPPIIFDTEEDHPTSRLNTLRRLHAARSLKFFRPPVSAGGSPIPLEKRSSPRTGDRDAEVSIDEAIKLFPQPYQELERPAHTPYWLGGRSVGIENYWRSLRE